MTAKRTALAPKHRLIGIFDSGIGGLTVARAVREVLPKEAIIYFGDTAHLPYGDKSTAAIQAYAVKIVDLLLKQHCKLILIACNSASAAAYELVKEYVGSKALVVNVIDPVVAYINEHYADAEIGLIGTKQTVSSNVYLKKINQLKKDLTLHSKATPLLAPMIEEGFFNNQISADIIDQYLDDKRFANISAMVLACTHYPLISDQIMAYFEEAVETIDSATIVAKHVKAVLEEKGLINDGAKLDDHFMVSDYTDSFEHTAKRFFGGVVKLEKYPLWE